MAISTSTPPSTVLAIQKTLEPIYTGGRVELIGDADGEILLMRSGDKFAIRDPIVGQLRSELQLEGEDINITAYTMKDADTMITSNSHNLFEAHASPISVMIHHAKFPLLATGSTDHCVRVWDSEKSYCTHNFKGVHGGIITCLMFHPNPRILHLISGGMDGSLAVWDLLESHIYRVFKGAHVSAVTAVSVSMDGKLLLSAGRDQVVNLWSLGGDSATKPIRTLAMMEVIEAAGFIDNGRFYTAGGKGIVRIWDVTSGNCVGQSNKLVGDDHTITQVKLLKDELLVFTSDLFLNVLGLADLGEKRLMVGHHGEVTDSTIFNSCLIIASNSAELRVYHSLISVINNDLCCKLLKGHTEAVISLASSEVYLVSGSRDHTALVWNRDGSVHCKLIGHTDVVSAIAAGKKKPHIVATGSADMTLKLWDVNSASHPTLKWTIKAHEKDINSIIFTPNDKYIISASQDKLIKVWKAEDGMLIRTLKGHKRGVWSIAVSPIEPVIASASADRTIKLWSITDGNCVKTLEGHTNSVLRIQFIKGGSQLVSAGSDGLLKVWDIRRGECISTIDGHADRIWTLITADDYLVSGDASGVVKVWKDVTEQVAIDSMAERDRLLLREQELSNLVLKKDFKNAATLAMQLEQPHRLYNLFGQLVDGRCISDALGLLEEILHVFTDEQITRLLLWLRDWNTSLKRAYVSQLLLHVILKTRQITNREREVLQQIKPYNQRHFERIDGLLINSYMIDFVVSKIK